MPDLAVCRPETVTPSSYNSSPTRKYSSTTEII